MKRFIVILVSLFIVSINAFAQNSMIDEYNEKLEYLKKLQEEGRVLIISPDDCCGVNTLKRTKESITRLYEKGYKDAEKIKAFVEG